MKYFYIILACLALENTACRKSNDCDCSGTAECAIITQVQSACNSFGIKLSNGEEYPSATIPDEFKVNGLRVCVQYTLYDDMRLCACCGGKWATIQKISKADGKQ
jgi:hypothetical protein